MSVAPGARPERLAPGVVARGETMEEAVVERTKRGGRPKMPAMNEERPAETTGLDETIGRVEHLYRAVTGRDAPPSESVYSPIPVERDPAEYVEEQMTRLLDLLGTT